MGAIGTPYITNDQLRAYLSIASTDAALEVALSSACAAASGEVESYCRRQFNQDTTASPRIYEPAKTLRAMPLMVPLPVSRTIIVDDFYDLSTLVVEISILDNSWVSPPWTLDVDYHVEPLNGRVMGKIRPYRRIVVNPKRPLISDWDRIRVTAKWGWPSIPPEVVQATLVLAAYNFKVATAPLGLPSTGMQNRRLGDGVVKVAEHPQLAWLLNEYRVNASWVG